jgi:hypothetical protein
LGLFHLTLGIIAYSCLIPRTRIDGLTRSQRLFSLATNIDPRSLLIREHDEFCLFMDMRAELKWISHEMTPKRWVQATMEYNKCLPARAGPLEGSSVIPKNPLALSRKLGEIEQMVMTRIIKGNFKCKSTGTAQTLPNSR